MSKRQLNNRIKSLFAELGAETQVDEPRQDSLPTGWTWESDAGGNYIAVSAEITRCLGYQPERFIGKTLFEGLTPETAPTLAQALESEHFPVDLQLNYKTLSGASLPTNVQLYPVPWQPEEIFHREAIQGWRAVVHPADPSAQAITPPSKRSKPTRTAQAGKARQTQGEKAAPGAATSPQTPVAPLAWMGAPMGYQAENHHLQPTQEVLTDLGLISLGETEVISRPSSADEPAILAISKPLANGEASLLLELLDEEPGRKWNDSERMLVEQVVDQMSLALENAQLFQQTQNALAATSALYAASAAFSAAQSYADVLDALRNHTILGEADTLLAIHYFERPWTATHPTEAFEILSIWSAPQKTPESELRQFRLRPDSSPEEAPFLNAERITIHNLFAEADSGNKLLGAYRDQFRANNLVFVPLVTGGQWLGFISAGYSAPVQFSQEEERRLMALAGQAAITINNLHLLAETRQRNLELAAINSVIAAASRSLALEEMLNEVLGRVLETVGYSAGLIALTDANGELKLTVQQKVPLEYLEWLERFGFEGSLTRLVYQQRKPIQVGDLKVNPPVDTTSLLHFGLRSFMGVPLESKSLILGIISVFGDQPKSGDETRLPLLQAIGQQVAVAVENAS
jgi:GAF domain-containing protein